MSFQDKTLTCSDCKNPFTFSTDEQEQFHARGYTNEPKRCPDCRQARKAERYSSSGNNYSSSNGERSFGFSTSREMFPAVCATCGKATTVPFQPRQDRPVYCSDCYRKRSGR
ncbi:MAG TPA: zinc-ribbon domain containing protein [Candidatus Hydrogenedentes bacterium]|nr:zinc-ribbon domain containing protein [Candidatus Hydrogenedentota bacterium]